MKKCFTILQISLFIFHYSFGQGYDRVPAPHGWHLMDNKSDGYYGISLDKAYALLKGRTSKTVIVAVIDGGIDTAQKDLKAVLWTNAKEIPGNGKDDDGNGYIDDIHGWNFLGGKDGRSVVTDTREVQRMYYLLKEKYQKQNKPDTTDKEYLVWQEVKENLEQSKNEATDHVQYLQIRVEQMKYADTIICKAMDKKKYTGAELQTFQPKNEDEKKAKNVLMSLVMDFGKVNEKNTDFITGIQNYYDGEKSKSTILNQPLKNWRGEIVKDDESDINDRYYGNNNITVDNSLPGVLHGTHVAGIIGAMRNNGIGMDGVADNIRIMGIRIIAEDEHDKDVALAIHYAVDNGAQIINLSFGKPYSPNKAWIDEAVKYAESKDVLIVHAAGNDSKNMDDRNNYYPNPDYANNKVDKANNWITVAASGDLSLPDMGGIVAVFSNYGKEKVDLFAPGVKIYSTLPGNHYGDLDGTSMAAPVVSGVAALILSYYPDLSAKQLKYIIEQSVSNPGMIRVGRPAGASDNSSGTASNPADRYTAFFNELSKTGGIVNAYEAIKMAGTLKGERKKVNE